MFIAELVFTAAEILFLAYLVRKGREIAKEMHKLKGEPLPVEADIDFCGFLLKNPFKFAF